MRISHVALTSLFVVFISSSAYSGEGSLDPRVTNSLTLGGLHYMTSTVRQSTIRDIGYFGPGLLIASINYHESNKDDAYVRIYDYSGRQTFSALVGSSGNSPTPPFSDTSPWIRGVCYDGSHVWISWQQQNAATMPSLVSKYTIAFNPDTLTLVESFAPPAEGIISLEFYPPQPDRLLAVVDYGGIHRMFSFSKTDGSVLQEEAVPAGYSNVKGLAVSYSSSGDHQVWVTAIPDDGGRRMLRLDQYSGYVVVDEVHIPTFAPGPITHCPDLDQFVLVGGTTPVWDNRLLHAPHKVMTVDP